MFSRGVFENSRPGGMAVLEVPGEEGRNLFVPLRHSELTGDVAGPLASLRLRQTYGYRRQQCDRVLQAFYRFPLPGDAAVTGVCARFGDVEVKADLQQREAAEAAYQQAVDEGRQAALVTRAAAGVFTLQLAGIEPDQDVTVDLSYVQLARTEGDGWSLRLPLTTAPRYVRSDELSSRHAQGQPLALLADPGHRFGIDLRFDGAAQVESPTHALATVQEDGRLRVRLEQGETLPDRDCVLRWRLVARPDRPTLRVWLDQAAAGEPVAGQPVHFLACVAPPALQVGPTVPRQITLLVDHSGSMSGPKWEAADWTVKRFLSELTPADTFNLGLFHNTTFWFARSPQPATPAAVTAAIAYLEGHRDSGGTELGVALEQALSQERQGGEAARHVLLVTDAQVSDAGRILRLADDESRRPERRRISLICIDAAPNSALALQLAERGGGVARFLTSSPDEEDIATALDEVLADWAEPILANLRLQVDREQVQAAGRQTHPIAAGGSAVDLGDLPAGRAIWVAGRVAGDAGAPSFRLLAHGDQQLACWPGEAAYGQPYPAARALFGAYQVLALEHLMASGRQGAELAAEVRRLGYDPQQVLAAGAAAEASVYAENAREDAARALRDLLVHESLYYGLASAETAFVASRMQAGRRVEGSVLVANALPAGWSEEFIDASRGVRAFGTPLPAPAPPAASASAGAPAKRALRALFGSLSPGHAMPASLASSAMPLGPRQPEAYQAPVQEAVLFSGAPHFVEGAAVLFDSSAVQGAVALPDEAAIKAVSVAYQGDGQPAQDVLRGLTLLIYVGDLAVARARVTLADMQRQGGTRPLNLHRRPGEPVRLVLAAVPGLQPVLPAMTVTLRLG